MAGPQVTHEQIYSRLGKLEGLVEAEGDARKEFRSAFQHRLEGIEEKVTEVVGAVRKLEDAALLPVQEKGVAHAVIRLLDRQPILGLVLAAVILGLGSSGLIAMWEAFTL